MRRFTILSILALAVSVVVPAFVTAASPPPIIQGNVTVTNTPLPVQVTNPTPPAPNAVTVNNTNANPLPITGNVTVSGSACRYRFVGYSSGFTSGAAGGYPWINKFCSEYGPEARICTTEEWRSSSNLSAPPPNPSGVRAAWISPGRVQFIPNMPESSGCSSSYALFDPGSGRIQCREYSFDCYEWFGDLEGTNPTTGLVVSAHWHYCGHCIGFSSLVCSNEFSVTCCAP